MQLPLLLACCLGVAVLAAMCVGRYPIDAGQLLKLLAGDQSDPTAVSVLWQVRGPRVLTSALVGAALAASGVALQSVFRNPLAAPDLLGVSAGAALGAVLGILSGWALFGIQLAAFLGGLVAVAMVWLIGTRLVLRDGMLSLVLAGFAIGSLLGALVSLVKLFADPLTQLPAMTFWLLGSFTSVSARELMVLASCLVLAFVPLVALRWQADALALSDDEVRSLGVRLVRLRVVLVLGATLATAASVAVAGTVGWVGLIVPHAARLLVGVSVARVLPVAMLLGALLMVLIDTLGRSLGSFEIAPGVLTALIGAPALFLLMARNRSG
jgi:iron complex transport system permease protein